LVITRRQKQYFKAGGRRVNLFEPAGEFYAASVFCFVFGAIAKNEDARAAKVLSKSYLPRKRALQNHKI
jgi:hypothetical protein